jgi:hypothetical protein
MTTTQWLDATRLWLLRLVGLLALIALGILGWVLSNFVSHGKWHL